MKSFTFSNRKALISELQDEFRRSKETRYNHRLHAILLVAQGMSCPETARVLGDSTRTVQYWVRRFKENGFNGLADADRPGRPRRLNQAQLNEIRRALRCSPLDYGFESRTWDGRTLSAFIKRQFDIELGVRQCQRLFRELGFQLRKAWSAAAKAD